MNFTKECVLYITGYQNLFSFDDDISLLCCVSHFKIFSLTSRNIFAVLMITKLSVYQRFRNYESMILFSYLHYISPSCKKNFSRSVILGYISENTFSVY